MKMRIVLLAALMAVTVAPLLSSPSASSPGGQVALGNHEISIKKLAGTNITAFDPPGPYVFTNGNTAKFTNNTLNQVAVVSYNAATAAIESKTLNPGENHTFTQGVGASEVSFFIGTDNTKSQVRGAVIYAPTPGFGAPGLAALAILLMGSAAWALTRKREQTAA